MHRFLAPPDTVHPPAFHLPEREAHHALNVLRLRVGEEIAVLDGRGKEYRCTVLSAHRRSVEVKLVRTIEHPRPACELILVQSLLKSKAMDWVIQKATELGVSRIVPLLADRSVSQVDPGEADAKAEKWQATATEALKQSGSPWLPQIDAPSRIGVTLEISRKADLSFVAALQGEPLHPRTVIARFVREKKFTPRTVCYWIGPEGDFTPSELTTLVSAGVAPISLGSNVLRSETAALYCTSILRHELTTPTIGG